MNVSLYYICSNALSVNILGALEAETEGITLKEKQAVWQFSFRVNNNLHLNLVYLDFDGLGIINLSC